MEGTAEMGLEATAEAAVVGSEAGEAVVIEGAEVVAEVMDGVVVVAPVAEEEGMGEGAAAAGVDGKSPTVLSLLMFLLSSECNTIDPSCPLFFFSLARFGALWGVGRSSFSQYNIFLTMKRLLKHE